MQYIIIKQRFHELPSAEIKNIQLVHLPALGVALVGNAIILAANIRYAIIRAVVTDDYLNIGVALTYRRFQRNIKKLWFIGWY